MARLPLSPIDPSRDAAALLRRLGFALLFAAAGLVGFAGASGLPIILVQGVLLLAIAAALDRAQRPVRPSFGRLAASPTLLAVAVLLGWAALSLLWTPAVRPAGARVAGLAAVGALALAGYLALPDRMRSANLYLAPIGTAMTAVLLLGLGFMADDPGAARRLERGVATTVLIAWPSIAWLRSRGRDIEAVLLALAVAAAAASLADRGPILALAAGALGFLAVQAAGRAGALAVGLLLAGLVVLAPALLAYGVPAVGAPQGAASWSAALLREPVRLLTGHGFEALPGVDRSGPGGAGLPGARLLEIWYELGVVGAVALATALVAGLRAAATAYPTLLPGIAATVATAFGLTLSGIDRGEAWWPAACAVAGLAFVAVERGQFRTRRPRAFSFGRIRQA